MTYYDRGAIAELETDILPRLEAKGLAKVKRRLASASYDVSFALGVPDLTGMGFPLVIAGAATFVDHAGGVIQSGTYSWMVPDGSEVSILCEVDRSLTKQSGRAKSGRAKSGRAKS
jgi:hypothetical protein